MCDKCDGSGRHRLKAWDNSYICQRCMGTGGDPVLGLSYAGVGSRVAPLPIIREIENIGMMLALRGLILRSGMHARPVPRVENTASVDEAVQPLELAEWHNIPVFNLAVSPVAELWPWMDAL